MPVTKVIQLAPKIDLMAIASVQVSTFTQQMTITLAAVDDRGEQVRGGATVTDVLTGADFDELIALMLPAFLPVALEKLVKRGKLAAGASVADAKTADVEAAQIAL